MIVHDTDFLLGTFAANCSGGMAVTAAPERWVNSWANNLAMAKVADRHGIDFLLPIARWIGYGGETDFHGDVLDPMAWAAALLASTSNITLFATVHAALQHPAVIAKQIATLDAIGSGRAGLNVVAGWNAPEYRAMGQSLPDDHETRYAYAQEWFDIIQKLWTQEARFAWDGTYFHLDGIYSAPVLHAVRRSSTPPDRRKAGVSPSATRIICSPPLSTLPARQRKSQH